MGTYCIILSNGMATLVDKPDAMVLAGRVWNAQARSDGNGFYAVDSNGMRMHRAIMAAPNGLIVDHINGDGLDNRRSNLRIGTQSQNCVNRLRTPGKYLRGARPKKGKWQAYIKYAGKQRSLGYFPSESEAHSAYLAAATELHGDWMPLPEPPSAD